MSDPYRAIVPISGKKRGLINIQRDKTEVHWYHPPSLNMFVRLFHWCRPPSLNMFVRLFRWLFPWGPQVDQGDLWRCRCDQVWMCYLDGSWENYTWEWKKVSVDEWIKVGGKP